ncbi:MAG: hypothetical protein RL072_30 [Actinomycetota bacterium]
MLARLLPVVAVVVLTGCADGEAAEPVVYVAAASDTREAFTELAAKLKDSDGIDVKFVFGSSGMLREQVLNGAPYDVYVSANAAFVAEVVDAGFAQQANVREYARGVLALISRNGVELPKISPTNGTLSGNGSAITLANFFSALDRRSRFAIANPAHAPYGVAAKESLESLGVYDEFADRLILAENVADAVRIVAAGEADFGLVALALVRDRDHVDIDSGLHQPIRQTAALTKRGENNPAARKFIDLLVSPEGISVLVEYGFVVDGRQ